ncbi:cation diffusion facilitator family transporter [Thermosipho melanesiensis]|uniref:Cation diffusion facilitator family transporter n=2 Tax=Thermosipho melanesiensis TaxID=46541 RepID=A6LJ50_THEM4|nr:cation diffusion facilitator family transporter [Thermosipho melanesiensis]ABR29951.1 cation diffusion facilitator family transporter [Thermosipho melanesiensis BI429]APT73157.1 Cation diffusion facilitator family transporter [Thermosipho melanesiensis]OOC38553.1 cation diffusion facilitator family transporter [Thermosipho melanesiensis]OOC40357.1 cation diffusion facilitator family transporter [Thermosipho melanesiensis]OOC40621.1 cation diffusion facilitator family transporter [Thermosiph
MEKTLKKVTTFAVVTNTFLAVIKIITGILFNSMAVLADGIDSSTDIITSIIVFLATRYSSKPPDKLHPYGHTKAENIGAKIISFIVFYAGISLLIESFLKLVKKEYILIPGFLPLFVTLISVLFKTILFIVEYRIGKKYNRSSLVAEALNMRNDIMLSTIVFLGVFLNKTGLAWMDPLVGILMSVIIIKVAFEIFSENAHLLLDGIHPEDEWIYDAILKVCKDCGKIKNPHKIRVRKIGINYDIDMDIEVEPNMTVKESHELTKCIKEKLINITNNKIYDVVIHVEPLENIEIEPYGIRGDYEKTNHTNNNNS